MIKKLKSLLIKKSEYIANKLFDYVEKNKARAYKPYPESYAIKSDVDLASRFRISGPMSKQYSIVENGYQRVYLGDDNIQYIIAYKNLPSVDISSRGTPKLGLTKIIDEGKFIYQWRWKGGK